MDAFYSDIQENGRETILTIRRWEDWEYDLESEFDGVKLLEIIQEWLSENAVGGAFNLSDATENFARLWTAS